jgi:hypothetical protein
MTVWTARAWVWAVGLALVVGACGDDGDGNDDTLLTGLSGVVILVIVVWLIVRALRKRG